MERFSQALTELMQNANALAASLTLSASLSFISFITPTIDENSHAAKFPALKFIIAVFKKSSLKVFSWKTFSSTQLRAFSDEAQRQHLHCRLQFMMAKNSHKIYDDGRLYNPTLIIFP